MSTLHAVHVGHRLDVLLRVRVRACGLSLSLELHDAKWLFLVHVVLRDTLVLLAGVWNVVVRRLVATGVL